MPRTRRAKQRGGGITDVLPTTSWGSWSSYPGALAWSANTAAPAPIANGGLFTGPQSTGEWASQPFPATQYALAVESAKVSQMPDVFYHQRPVDNSVGNGFSPYVGAPLSSEHYSAKPMMGGGSRKHRLHTIYGSWKDGSDIRKDTRGYYVTQYNPATDKTYKKYISYKPNPAHICRAVQNKQTRKWRHVCGDRKQKRKHT